MDDGINPFERLVHDRGISNTPVQKTVMRGILRDIGKIRRVAGVRKRIEVGDEIVRVGAAPVTNEVTADKP